MHQQGYIGTDTVGHMNQMCEGNCENTFIEKNTPYSIRSKKSPRAAYTGVPVVQLTDVAQLHYVVFDNVMEAGLYLLPARSLTQHCIAMQQHM